MQNIRTKKGIETRARDYVEKNPRCSVSADKEPHKLFNRKELEVYGEAHLKPVVAKIHELLAPESFTPQDVRSDGPVGSSRTGVSHVPPGSQVHSASYRKLWIGGFPMNYNMEDVREHLHDWLPSFMEIGPLLESKGFGGRLSQFINPRLVISAFIHRPSFISLQQDRFRV